MQTRIVALDGVTTLSAEVVSDPIDITNAKKISIILTRASGTSGNTVFKAYLADDNDVFPYIQVNQLISNSANTNAQTQEMVGTITLT